MSLKIDFHTHIFPDLAKKVWPKTIPFEKLLNYRKHARQWFRPYSQGLHQLQSLIRHFPTRVREVLDPFGGIGLLPSLLVESSVSDLNEALIAANIDYALVIAHPPFSPNEWILEVCQENPKLIPVVNVPSGTQKPGLALKKLIQQGAKLLKIHPASDGEGVHSPRYRALLRTAEETGIPVILHTGCFHSKLLFKDPEQGQAQRFSPWFEKHPGIRFILAHMNLHEPNIALDLCEEYPNLWVDTSWQPPEVIGEAVRRLGAEKVLFGTDWPIAGHNMMVGISRIQDCLDAGTLTQYQADQVMGINAANLLGIACP